MWAIPRRGRNSKRMLSNNSHCYLLTQCEVVWLSPSIVSAMDNVQALLGNVSSQCMDGSQKLNTLLTTNAKRYLYIMNASPQLNTVSMWSHEYLHFCCSGNYKGHHPFKKGDACTECGSGKGWCDNGLCREGGRAFWKPCYGCFRYFFYKLALIVLARSDDSYILYTVTTDLRHYDRFIIQFPIINHPVYQRLFYHVIAILQWVNTQ